MGTWPLWSASSLRWSLSTRTISCPMSAKQAPATRPTYPEPTTAMRIGESLWILAFELPLTRIRVDRFYRILFEVLWQTRAKLGDFLGLPTPKRGIVQAFQCCRVGAACRYVESCRNSPHNG